MTTTTTIALLSNDLMFSSSLSACAAAVDAQLRVVASPAELLRLSDKQTIALVLLDLATPGYDMVELVPKLRQAATPPRAIIAYGPHVHAEKLAAARQAGCDEVLSRGQFHGQMQAVIARHAPI